MNIKQIESIGMNVLAVFGMAFGGAVYSCISQGQIPSDWPGIRKVLATAALAGATAVFGWIKLKSPWATAKPGALNDPAKTA